MVESTEELKLYAIHVKFESDCINQHFPEAVKNYALFLVIFSAFCIINNFTHQITFKKSMLQYLKTTYVYQVHFLNEEYN